MGPETTAPLRLAVSTIFCDDWSSKRWSNAFKRMRIFCLAMVCPPFMVRDQV
jgi:hypothetical protein